MEQDTIRLLRECDAGVKMGIKSIDDVVDYVKSDAFKKYLNDCKREHEKLNQEIESMLSVYHIEDKEPNQVITKMSSMKTAMKIKMNKSDYTIASLMTDGCNMGVKSLNKYLNEYKKASDTSKEITMRLIKLEERLAVDIRQFL